MTWLVFGVSGLLVLAGAVSVSSGAPIIQLERGWAEVIAGTVAMSGGGVVFAIGVVLMRLESLRDAIASATIAPPTTIPVERTDTTSPVTPAVAFVPSAPPPEPTPPLDEGAATPADAMLPLSRTNPPDPVPGPEMADQGLWKRIKRPADAAETLVAEGFPDLAPPAPPAAETAGAVSPIDVVGPSEEPLTGGPVVPAPSRAVPSPAAKDDPGQLGWLERSLFKGRAQKERDAEARDNAQNGRVEPAIGDIFRDPARTEPAVEMPEPAAAAAEAAPPTAPADDGPTVIGRYQAGVASYVMYSDGTIEVETEGGQSHRFGSMDELKAFIASQDEAGA